MSAPESVRTTENQAILERFYVRPIAPELDQHKRVPLTVFREERLTDEEYAALLFPLDANDGMLRTAVDETFTADEVDLLREFLAVVEPTWEFAAEPVTPIGADAFGLVVCGAGGPTEIICWPHPETRQRGPAALPIGVFYDLRAAEDGPHIDRLSGRPEVIERGGKAADNAD